MNKNLTLKHQNIEASLPLYNRFFKLQRRVTKQFPHENIQWPGAIGLAEWNSLSKLKNGGYYCTPLNSLAFAWTGTDGEHFSFLVRNAKITERSPIILTVPTNYDGTCNIVVAKNFRTFLRLLLRYGWFELTELGYQPQNAIQAFLESSRVFIQQQEKKPNVVQREVCAFVSGLLDLPPYFYTEAEFKSLQQKYIPLLKMPEGYTAEHRRL
ncbi:MAG: hypothetical protein ACFB0D_03055 [Phormidesmis sp.]